MGNFQCAIERLDGQGVAMRLHGSIDLYSSSEFRLALESVFSDSNKLVLIDMSDVEFVDSSAIATLAEGLTWSRQDQRRFVLAGLSSMLLDIFSIAKLDTVFDIVDDADAFLSSL